MESRFSGFYFLRNTVVELDIANPHCPVTPTLWKAVKPLSDKVLKSKEDKLLEMYIKNYITETQFYEMLNRIKKEK